MAFTTQDIQGWLSQNAGIGDAGIANAMQQFGVSAEQMAAATGLSANSVQQRFDAAMGGPAPAAQQQFSNQDIQGWLAQNAGIGDRGVANAMDQYGVGIGQMAEATGLSNRDVSLRYSKARDPSHVDVENPAEMARWRASGGGVAAATTPSGKTPIDGDGGLWTGGGSTSAPVTPGGGGQVPAPSRNSGGTPRPPPPVIEQPTRIPGYSAPSAAPAAMPNQVALRDPTRYDQNNPYLKQMGDSITDQVNQNLSRNMLPQISSQAVSSGNFGGSRQGVVEANAFRDANGQLANALTGMRFGDYNNTMQRQLQQYGQDQNYNLGIGNLALGNKNSDQSYDLGQGNLQLGNKTADNSFSLGQGNLQLGNKNSDQGFALGVGNLGLGFQNSDNSFALGQGNLQLQNKSLDQGFYTQQRGQDLQQVGLGASIFGQGNQGMLSQGQGIYNLGLTEQQAPGQALQGFNNAAGPFTGTGTTSSNQSGSGGAGFLGGALAGSQAYNIFSGGGSGPMDVRNTGGFTNTPNYLITR